MNWNVFSLVLACATGWSLLFAGYLPVSIVRRLTAEPVKATGAWALVAATAPPAIFHWYLIFALICLVAWTKLERPAGKIWLGAAGALGLSLGIVFPLETALDLPALKHPLPLAALYVGGAASGLAYLIWLLAGLDPGPTVRRAAAWLPAGALGFIVIRGFSGTTASPRANRVTGDRLDPHFWIPVILATLLLVAAVLTWHAIRRNAFLRARGLAALTGLVAFASTIWFEFALRAGGSPIAAPR